LQSIRHGRAIPSEKDYVLMTSLSGARARLQTSTSDTVLPPNSGITSSGPSSLWRSSRQVSYTIRYLSKGCPNHSLSPSPPFLSCARAWRFYARFHNNILYCSVLSFDVVCCIETTLCRPTPRLNRSGTCSGSPYAILVNRWRSGAVCDCYNL
jgi:hypothetical protein